MFTTGNLLAFIAFMVVVLIASILVGVIYKRLTAGVTVFCVGLSCCSFCSGCARHGF